MTLTFQPLEPGRQEDYGRYLSRCLQRTSDYSFINLWGWSEAHGLRWAWQDDLVWIQQTRPQAVYWAPVGPWQDVDWSSAMAAHFPEPVRFARVPGRLLEIWQPIFGQRLVAREARGDWDYVYAVDELIGLTGKRFHKKKNLVNQFRKNYDYVYRPLSPETIDDALSMQQDWCTWRDCEAHETLTAENRAIEKILGAWRDLSGVTGGALFVADKMVAYTVAEALSDQMLLIHFEKADPDYKGSYQAINRMFLAHAAGGFTRVNREQDLDDPGLRKAKLSYHPVDFLRKYDVSID